MSSIKNFLDKRAKGIAKEDALKKGIKDTPKKTISKTVISPELGFKVIKEEVEIETENKNLSDDEFWDITNTFNKEIKVSNLPVEIILQKILENYTPLKIQQFAKRYEELNK